MTWKILARSIAFIICFLAALLVLTTFWLEDKFGIVSIEAIIFHLQNPLGKTPIAYPLSFLKRVVGVFFIALLWLTCFQFKPFNGNARLATALLASPLIFMMSAVFFVCGKFGVPAYLAAGSEENKFIEDNYYQVDIGEIKFPEKKRNVIILVLESVEMNFNDEKTFPESLMPRLAEMQDNSVSCHLRQAPGAEWTVGSLVGLLFGLPLRLPADGNQYRRVDNFFLPGAISLLEIFESNGYSVNMVAGNDITFAGVRNILLTHLKSPGIYDLNYFKSLGLPQESKWGVRDKHVYQATRGLILEMSRAETPFLMLIKSVDTHSPVEVYVDGQRIFSDARDAFVTADNLAAEFLGWLVEQDFYADTTVLVVGDHLYMGTELGPVALSKERSPLLYNAFLNTIPYSGRPGAKRITTMWDMGASLLHGIGVELPSGRFGLGVSIFHDRPTLAEQFSNVELTSLVRGRSLFYEKFFLPPDEL